MVGMIFTIMLVVDCLFFMFLEWWLPEETLDKVQLHWCRKSFEEVRLVRRFDCGVFDIQGGRSAVVFSERSQPAQPHLVCTGVFVLHDSEAAGNVSSLAAETGPTE